SGASGTFASGSICAGGLTCTVTSATVNGVVGLATSSILTANTVAGQFTVPTTSGTLTSATFTETNNPGPATKIVVNSGNNQQAQVTQTFSQPLVAQVQDANGNGVNGVSVTFTAPSSGASGTFASGSVCAGGLTCTVTSATVNGVVGLATSSTFTANTIASAQGATYPVSATAAGVGTAVNFSLTNQPGPPSSITP